jgi:hypothetical protein
MDVYGHNISDGHIFTSIWISNLEGDRETDENSIWVGWQVSYHLHILGHVKFLASLSPLFWTYSMPLLSTVEFLPRLTRRNMGIHILTSSLFGQYVSTFSLKLSSFKCSTKGYNT